MVNALDSTESADYRAYMVYILCTDGNIYDSPSRSGFACSYRNYRDLHIRKRGGNIRYHRDAILGVDIERCLEQRLLALLLAVPSRLYPSVGILLTLHGQPNIRAIALVHRDAVALGDKSDKLVTRQRVRTDAASVGAGGASSAFVLRSNSSCSFGASFEMVIPP